MTINPDDRLILKNPPVPQGIAVLDYPISQAMVDSTGNYKTDTESGEFISTGETFEWTIKPGEELQFPPYVAKSLTDRYHFLELICPQCRQSFKYQNTDTAGAPAYERYAAHKCDPKIVEQVKEPAPEAAVNTKEAGIIRCKFCPMTEENEFKNKNNLAMHLASKHPEEFTRMMKS